MVFMTKRHMWVTDLVLTTPERSSNLIIGFLMANLPNLPNFRSLESFHGLEEVHVVHQPGPGHLGEVGEHH